MLRDPRHAWHSAPGSESDLVSRARSRTTHRGVASAKVAMIGAGPLARMTHQASADLDVDFVVLAESLDDSAVLGGASYRLGSASCLADIQAVAAGADAVIFDHELVAGAHLVELERLGFRLRPASSALSLARNRLKARTALSAAGFPVSTFGAVSSPQDVVNFAEECGWPVVVKSAGGGHDGRGVHFIDGPGQLADLFDKEPCESHGWLVEQYVDIAAELFILIARTVSGRVALYPAVQTIQRAGICRYQIMPAPLPSPITEQAGRIAKSVADGIDATGMLAVGMFLDTNGRLLVNDLAFRPHNSGRVTFEACETSQFHQHLRATLDWPLGATTLRGPAATVNLMTGSDAVDLADRLPAALAVSGAHVHLYSNVVRPGRVFGHVTALGSSIEQALETAQTAAVLLT